MMTTQPALTTEDALVAAYRATHPRSRAVHILPYLVDTSCRKQRRCIVCNEVGPSWSSKWPQTRRARDWERDHRVFHGLDPEHTVTPEATAAAVEAGIADERWAEFNRKFNDLLQGRAR